MAVSFPHRSVHLFRLGIGWLCAILYSVASFLLPHASSLLFALLRMQIWVAWHQVSHFSPSFSPVASARRQRMDEWMLVCCTVDYPLPVRRCRSMVNASPWWVFVGCSFVLRFDSFDFQSHAQMGIRWEWFSFFRKYSMWLTQSRLRFSKAYSNRYRSYTSWESKRGILVNFSEVRVMCYY
jgi:hypothetical protein